MPIRVTANNDNSDVQAETSEQRGERFRKFLEDEVWPHIPPEERGKPITKEEQEEILGFGPDGV